MESQTFQEWMAKRQDAKLRPYANESGEVDQWKLKLTLNDLGRAFLVVDKVRHRRFAPTRRLATMVAGGQRHVQQDPPRRAEIRPFVGAGIPSDAGILATGRAAPR
jgi:hypothetical protein